MKTLKISLRNSIAILATFFSSFCYGQSFRQYTYKRVEMIIGNDGQWSINNSSKVEEELDKNGKEGWELVATLESRPNGAYRPEGLYVYQLIFKKASSPNEEYLKSLVNTIDKTASEVVKSEVAKAKIELMDQLNGLTKNTLTDDFRKQLVEYIDAVLEEKLKILKKAIDNTVNKQ